METRVEKAAEKKMCGFNCAQAVACIYCDLAGLDEETMRSLNQGFAVGIGASMEATCGALVGAVMAAGLMTDGQGTGRMARATLAGFQDRCGATICKDLKGIETGTVLCPCTECVRNAVLAAGEALGLE